MEGIKIGSSELPMRMFANDTVLTVKVEELVVVRVWDVVLKYCCMSSQSIGIAKMKALWISDQP